MALEEYARKSWLTTIIEINIANLAGVPSIIWGLMSLGLLVYGLKTGQSILTAGLTLTLKLKDTKFKIITRRRQLPEPTLLASRIFGAARELLAGDADGRTKYRLIGVGLSDFSDAANADKGDMLDTTTPKRAVVEAAVAKARDKFGKTAVQTGRALKTQFEDEDE